MTTTLITTSGLSAGIAHTFAAAGDSLFLAQGVTWGSSDSGLYNTTLDNIHVVLMGNAIASDNGAYFYGEDSTLTILEGGSFTSLETNSGNSGIYFGDLGGTLNNAGTISATQAVAVLNFGAASIFNSGLIEGSSGVYISGNDGGAVTNSGVITANSSVDVSSATFLNNAVYANVSATITNLAGGVMQAVSSEGAAVRLGDFGHGSDVTNHGDILSVQWYGVDFSGLFSGAASTFVNTGTVQGGMGAFNGSLNADLVTNSGLMIGDVYLGDGADDFDGTGGQVLGLIDGGTGDDVMRIDQEGADVDGGGDIDTLIVSANLGSVSGFETVRMVGTGDFAIRTDNTDSVINGNAGNNVLEGRGGEDTIRGGLGDDELVGGNGKDILIGGTGEDVFIYDTASESTVADSDRIRDLKRGEDVIDLSDVVTDAVFLGTGGFTTSGFSEVRYQVTGGVNARVEVDVDGDGSADMRMILTGNNLLDADDFIL